MSEQDHKIVRIAHRYPENLRSAYADHILVQHTPEGQFRISFFEIEPPALLGDSEAIEKEAEKIDSIDAMCVGRIIVSEKKLGAFIAALKKNHDNYQKLLESGALDTPGTEKETNAKNAS